MEWSTRPTLTPTSFNFWGSSGSGSGPGSGGAASPAQAVLDSQSASPIVAIVLSQRGDCWPFPLSWSRCHASCSQSVATIGRTGFLSLVFSRLKPPLPAAQNINNHPSAYPIAIHLATPNLCLVLQALFIFKQAKQAITYTTTINPTCTCTNPPSYYLPLPATMRFSIALLAGAAMVAAQVPSG